MPELDAKLKELETAEINLKQKQAELEKATLETAEKEKQKSALDAELARVQKDIATAKEDRRTKETSFQDRLRTENLEAAKKKFFGEFKYEPEAKTKILEAFAKRFDSGAVNPELIYDDLLAAHVAQNPRRYVGMEKRVNELAEHSEEFKAQMSSSGFSGAGAGPGDSGGLDKEDIEAARWAGIPLPKYKELKVKHGL